MRPHCQSAERERENEDWPGNTLDTPVELFDTCIDTHWLTCVMDDLYSSDDHRNEVKVFSMILDALFLSLAGSATLLTVFSRSLSGSNVPSTCSTHQTKPVFVWSPFHCHSGHVTLSIRMLFRLFTECYSSLFKPIRGYLCWVTWYTKRYIARSHCEIWRLFGREYRGICPIYLTEPQGLYHGDPTIAMVYHRIVTIGSPPLNWTNENAICFFLKTVGSLPLWSGELRCSFNARRCLDVPSVFPWCSFDVQRSLDAPLMF